MKNPIKSLFARFRNPMEYVAIQFESTKSGGSPSSPTANTGGQNQRVLKILLKQYKSIMRGKKEKVAKDYLISVHKTEGDFNKRSAGIKHAVRYAEDYSKQALTVLKSGSMKTKIKPEDTPIGILVRVMAILNDSKWKTAFGKAFKAKRKNKIDSSMDYIIMMYAIFVFTVEYLTLLLKKYEETLTDPDSDIVERALIEFSSEYRSFTINVLGGMASSLLFVESTKDPLQLINKLLSDEKEAKGRLSSTEANEYMGPMSISEEYFENEISEEVSADKLQSIAVIGLAIGLGIAGVVATIAAMRMAVYHIGVMKTDIGKTLEESAEMLGQNILKLEEKLETMDPESKEYEKLEKIIERQKKSRDKYMAYAEKIMNEDDKNVAQIDKDYNEDQDSLDTDIDDMEIVI